MMDVLRIRLREIAAAGSLALPRAARRIQAKLRADATTKRGNVPEISAKVSGDAVIVAAPEWVHAKAEELGQPADWRDILRDEVRRAAEGE